MSNPLVAIIEGACSPARFEPELSLNLEICEMINKKQGTAPREAAIAIVKIINSKNVNQGMLALTLLDNCVKNCGYPFHLQIATKEFLNALVRKFPERPAPFPSPVIQRVLYLIKEWKVALTEMSKHKDDLVHIKDMYRLLRFKGYRFPELRDSSVAALTPSDSLKSAHELEEEDRLAQSAKLQELIRRGRPQDLVEANRLMKIMSGFDTRQTPDYSRKFEDELSKIQDKSILLYEMLENAKPGDRIERNDTIMDLRNACTSAQPKIQKMITEEEDNDKIENLLILNDMINNAIAKYNDVKKGLFDTHYDISGKPPTENANSDETPQQGISLIDLDDIAPSSTASTPSIQSSKNAMDELSDIFGSSATISTPPQQPQQQPARSTPDIFDLLGQPSPSYNNTPSPSLSNQAIPPYSRSPSVSNSIPSYSPSMSHSSAAVQNNNGSNGSYQGSPVLSNANEKKINLVNKNGLQIVLQVNQVDTMSQIKASFSNQSTAPMEKLMLQLAAPKSMQLKMEPQSGQMIPPKSENAVTQNILVRNPIKEPLRLRYKVSYYQFGVEMELTGDYRA